MTDFKVGDRVWVAQGAGYYLDDGFNALFAFSDSGSFAEIAGGPDSDGDFNVRILGVAEDLPVNPDFFSTWRTEHASDSVDHPSHYGGEDNTYEAIKVIEAWGLGFSLGNTVKYLARAGKKDPGKELEDLRKAKWYLDHHIKSLETKDN